MRRRTTHESNTEAVVAIAAETTSPRATAGVILQRLVIVFMHHDIETELQCRLLGLW